MLFTRDQATAIFQFPLSQARAARQTMHSKILIGLSIAAAPAVCANTHRFTGSATCKLTNTAADAALYEGPRTVTQSETEYSTIFEVKMGGAESFLVASKKGDPNWMHGPDRVRFTDLPT